MEIFPSVTINMASARKKLDEKNLKFLRELLSHPGNKHCFDCNQRGPTYVNVTIGSFVCTTCSGMLRGLTPPHRVKSISMATFTQEEIDLMSARGNEYCKKVWLGLSDGNKVPNISHGGRDEQALKDYMISVYEKKSYYINPSNVDTMNGSAREVKPQQTLKLPPIPNVQSPSTAYNVLNINNNNNVRNNKNNNSIPAPALSPPKTSAVTADPFGSLGFVPSDSSSAPPVDNFANFDNNPVFANSSVDSTQQVDGRLSSMSDLSGIDFNPWGGNYQAQEAFSTPLQTSSCLSTPVWKTSSPQSAPYFQTLSSAISCKMSSFDKVPPPPSEDRYAALKDLDSLMKSQLTTTESPQPAPAPTPDWGQPAWSPNFDDAPRMQENTYFEKPFNPFSSTTENGWGAATPFGGNPFKTEVSWPAGNSAMSNGLPPSQSLNFNQTKSPWEYNQTPNPFLTNGSGQQSAHHSSNPFL
uniref:Arf-GAP domain and FG repeat-containing protein 1 n=2 Tax=Lygus hesperus TaxID=30085 RepID=A0A146LKM7_LYGHE